MNLDTYLDNQINAHLSKPEFDYQLIDCVHSADFSSLLGDNSQKTLEVLKTNSSEFEHSTIDNLREHLEFDFMCGYYCNMPYLFNSDKLEDLDNQVLEYCEFIIGEMK